MSSHDGTEVSGNDIAIVGMAGRFPGASSVDALWDNLLAGRESITRFSPEELFANGPHIATQQYEIGDPDLGMETAWGLEAYIRGSQGGSPICQKPRPHKRCCECSMVRWCLSMWSLAYFSRIFSKRKWASFCPRCSSV